jgi:hypothetical protein
MVTAAPELLPCPLCGAGAKVTPHGNNLHMEVPCFGVLCQNPDCGCRTQWRKAVNRAVSDWNNRVKHSD